MSVTVLCYGDSNTWGCRPLPHAGVIRRYTWAERWPGVLQVELGAGFRVIEEGLNGRTTLWDDPLGSGRNGRDYLLPCLETHQPVDWIILLLGTNDLKARFALCAADIAASVGVLVSMVQKHRFPCVDAATPRILLLAPPPIAEDVHRPEFFRETFAGGAAKSRQFGALYQRVAEQAGCEWLDTAAVLQVSSIDGIHWEAADHQQLGRALAQKLKDLTG